MATFKPVGVDENSNFPTRVVDKLKTMFPPLDGNSKVLEANLPSGLSSSVLAAKYTLKSRTPQIRTILDPTLAHADRATTISVPTYDGSNVFVHPSVYFNADGWNGYEYWMAFTPYPGADVTKENASIVVSHDGDTWVNPPGIVNPVVAPPANVGAAIYNSDPYLTLGNDGVMYLFWRTVGVPAGDETWYYKTSTDGVTWSANNILRVDVQATRRMVAGSIFQLADDSWVMYAVDIVQSPYKIVRLAAPTLAGISTAAATNVTITGNTAAPWHIDVHRVGGEIQMLVQDTGAAGGDLWAAVSRDGLNFIAGQKFLQRYVGSWDTVYYKSTFVPSFKAGKHGWDIWTTSASFPTSAPDGGRTFVYFDDTPSKEAAKAVEALRVDLMHARASIWPWLAADTFAQADAASLGTSETGHTWIADAGVFKISGKAAVPTSATNTRSVIDVATADHWVTARVDSTPNVGQHWICARFVDLNNFYRFGVNSIGVVSLEKVVAGTITSIATFPTLAWAATTAGTYFGLRVKGTTIEAFINGQSAGSYTDASLSVGTKVGIQATAATATFRAVTVRTS